MRIVDRSSIHAPIDRVFAVAADVERWPEILPHYRWVRMLERTDAGGLVEMAAWRDFGPVRYPTWWISTMQVLSEQHAIRYQHVRGLTRGMDVEWRMHPNGKLVEVTIVHEWTGPGWPLIGRIAADRVIGPVFIHAIASETLAGVKRKAETA